MKLFSWHFVFGGRREGNDMLWTLKKDKNRVLRNCLNTCKKSLLDLQVTLRQSDREPIKIISEARIQVGRTLINLNRVLEKLK